MSNTYEDEEDGIFAINVTPLVDVVLVLLVIFMVTATAIARRGIAFQEPATVSGSKIDSQIELTIDSEREIYVNGSRAENLDSVRASVAGFATQDSEAKALLTVDISVPHGDVMALIDAIKLGGVRKFAFASRHERTTAQPTP